MKNGSKRKAIGRCLAAARHRQAKKKALQAAAVSWHRVDLVRVILSVNEPVYHIHTTPGLIVRRDVSGVPDDHLLEVVPFAIDLGMHKHKHEIEIPY